MNVAIILKVLDIILLGMTLVPEAQAAGERLAEKLRGFGGKDPTPAQWDEINAETDGLLAGLRARAKAAGQEHLS